MRKACEVREARAPDAGHRGGAEVEIGPAAAERRGAEPAAWPSPPPATTSVPGRSPVAAAASGRHLAHHRPGPDHREELVLAEAQDGQDLGAVGAACARSRRPCGIGAAPARRAPAGQAPAEIAQHVDEVRGAAPMLGLAALQPVQAEHGRRRVGRLAGDGAEPLGRQLARRTGRCRRGSARRARGSPGRTSAPARPGSPPSRAGC